MRLSFSTLFATAGVLFAATAFADSDKSSAEQAAESCLTDKIWSGYSDGWAVRTATTTTLKQDEHRVYLLTLYAGKSITQVCADKGAKNVDLILHDLDGKSC